MHVIIVGNGVASFTLIRELLRESGKFEIDVFTQEKYPFYWRPRLIEVLANEADLDDITPHAVKWYEERDVNLHLSEEVEGVNFSEKVIFTSNGKTYSYDKLVLASGAKPFLPRVPGNDLKHVYTIRTYDDVKSVKKNYAQHKKFVIIGGGVLGLESAAALRRAGEEMVTIIEHSDRLLSRQLDVSASQIFETAFKRKYGVELLVSKSVSRIRGSEKVDGVVFTDGSEIDADVVIFSTGVRANMEFLDDDTLEIDKGIVVNERLETSVEDVYALGDVAQYGGRPSGTMEPAIEEAKVLAKVLNSKEVIYRGVIPSNVLKIAGLSVMSVGKFSADEVGDRFSCYGDMEKGAYKKVVTSSGKFTGAITVGVNKKTALSMKRIVENGESPTLPLSDYVNLEEGEV